MLTPDIVEELLASARETHAAIGAVPSYMWEGGVLDRLAGASRRLREVIIRAHEAQRPGELAALLPWIADHPLVVGPCEPVWGRIGTGSRAFATDGASLLVVDDVPDAPTEFPIYENPTQAAKLIQRLERGYLQPELMHRVVVDAWRLDDGLGGARVAIGEGVFSVPLIRRWIGVPASITGARIGGRVELLCQRHPHGVLVAPAADWGWRAYVMPIALQPGESADDVPRLTGDRS